MTTYYILSKELHLKLKGLSDPRAASVLKKFALYLFKDT